MHDDEILICDINAPWKVKGYSPVVFSIWHKGDCGWTYPFITKAELDKIQEAMKYQTDFFIEKNGKYFPTLAPLETLYGMSEVVSWTLWRKRLKPKHLLRIMSLVSDPVDNLRAYFENPLEYKDLEFLYWVVARVIKKINRPWYKHPRWHFHHWRIRCHVLLRFKRWAFSKCDICGGGFKWGEVTVSKQWHSKGPQWFKSETDVCHVKCYDKLPVAEP